MNTLLQMEKRDVVKRLKRNNYTEHKAIKKLDRVCLF